MVYLLIGILIFIIGAVVLDKFYLKPDSPIYTNTDEYKEELNEDVKKFQMEVKHIYIPSIFDVGPFEIFEHIPQTTNIKIFGMNIIENDFLIRNCRLVKNGKEYEVWCKIYTKWGKFNKVVWSPSLKSLE